MIDKKKYFILIIVIIIIISITVFIVVLNNMRDNKLSENNGTNIEKKEYISKNYDPSGNLEVRLVSIEYNEQVDKNKVILFVKNISKKNMEPKKIWINFLSSDSKVISLLDIQTKILEPLEEYEVITFISKNINEIVDFKITNKT